MLRQHRITVRIDGIEFEDVIGEGGMGRVHRGRFQDLPVAVKILHPDILKRPLLVERFRTTTEKLVGVKHAGLVEVKGSGTTDDGRPYAILDYLQGQDLGLVLSLRGAFEHWRAADIARQIAEALAAAHAAGVLHLDLKPTNVYLASSAEGERVKVLDFVGGAAPGEPPLGTAEYWSPEQACSGAVDARSDIYSLGVLLYEMVTGSMPFRSHSHAELVTQHLHLKPPSPRAPSGRPPIPLGLIAVIDRCLRKEPSVRFQSASELARALRPFCTAPAKPREDSAPSHPPSPRLGARTDTLPVECQPGLSSARKQPGDLLGSYRILELIGDGGMGHVYLAEHNRLGRKVAIKMLRAECAANPSVVRRFFAEAKMVNQISHEHIVEITDFVEHPGGDNYYIMEFLRGIDLHDLHAAEGVPELARSLRITIQICDALAAVHEAGIIHRDLKPDNVFLIQRGGREDFVKLLDFGVAKLAPAGSNVIDLERTGAGTIVGTPEYMSPEQISGKEIDLRTDIYSLGVILFQLVTGRMPFEASDFGDMVIKHVTQPPPRPSGVKGLPHVIPPALEQLILRCLEKQPEARPQSMREVQEVLDSILDALESDAVDWSMPLAVVPASSGSYDAVSTDVVVAARTASGEAARVATGPTIPVPVTDPGTAVVIAPVAEVWWRRKVVWAAAVGALAAAIGAILVMLATSGGGGETRAQSIAPAAPSVSVVPIAVPPVIVREPAAPAQPPAVEAPATAPSPADPKAAAKAGRGGKGRPTAKTTKPTKPTKPANDHKTSPIDLGGTIDAFD